MTGVKLPPNKYTTSHIWGELIFTHAVKIVFHGEGNKALRPAPYRNQHDPGDNSLHV